eukprot:evm.model.NODE_27093_length_6887_cov_19.901264.3
MFKEEQKRVPKDSFFAYKELIRQFVDFNGKVSLGGGEGATNAAAAPSLPPAPVAEVPPAAIAASPAFPQAPAAEPGVASPEAESPRSAGLPTGTRDPPIAAVVNSKSPPEPVKGEEEARAEIEVEVAP